MIPKPGDKVMLDPWYMGVVEGVFDAPLKVVHVASDGPWTMVTVSEPGIRVLRLKADGRWYGTSGPAAPALLSPLDAIDARSGQ